MRGLTAYIAINESALRILAEAGYSTAQQAAAFGTTEMTIRRRRRKWGIVGEKRARRDPEREGQP